jgi:diamine N-acetyltransferase
MSLEAPAGISASVPDTLIFSSIRSTAIFISDRITNVTIMGKDLIEYRVCDETGLEQIRPLWLQLNEHHYRKAGVFRSRYEQWTFDDRKAYFTKKAGQGALRVDVACDAGAGRPVGYCVSSVTQENVGEIESLFVEPAYRSRGIGTCLMDRALGWMDRCGAEKRQVFVADGNEEAWEFYRRFGFYPRKMMLEQLSE